MKPHLLTMVGGRIETMEAMLEHYKGLGLESFFVTVHLRDRNDPVREEVEAITRRFGCGVDEYFIGPWSEVQREGYRKVRRRMWGEWFLVADQDELSLFPEPVEDLIAECNQRKVEYVEGCFLDRVAADGSFPAWDPAKSLWESYPLGGAISQAMLQSDTRKVSLVRGDLPLCRGQHHIFKGEGLPRDVAMAQVHHFKWTGDIVNRMEERIELLSDEGAGEWVESRRFLDLLARWNGKLNLNEPALLLAPAGRTYSIYPHWEQLKSRVPSRDTRQGKQ